MTNKIQQYHGTLVKMPYPTVPTKAAAGMLPLTTDNDFEVFSEFTCSQFPVYLSIAEHYQMLSELVDLANNALPDISIVLRISMPGGMRLPANLLADNVLLLEDIAAEERIQTADNIRFLVIEDRFSRLEIENNTNAIDLRLYNEATANSLQSLINHLHSHGVVS
jgi:hypothetical protein